MLKLGLEVNSMLDYKRAKVRLHGPSPGPGSTHEWARGQEEVIN